MALSDGHESYSANHSCSASRLYRASLLGDGVTI